VRGGFLMEPLKISNRVPSEEKDVHSQASIKLCSTVSAVSDIIIVAVPYVWQNNNIMSFTMA